MKKDRLKMKNQIIAHLRERDRKAQSLWEHLSETSTLAGQFAGKIGLQDAGEALGILHDLGKASEEFQNYLGSAVGIISPDEDSYIDFNAMRGEIDHSTAGAQYLFQRFYSQGKEGLLVAQMLSLCLASHHSGLIDCLSPDGEDKFTRRMEKSDERTHLRESLEKLEPEQIETINAILSRGLGEAITQKMAKMTEGNDSKETLMFKFGELIKYNCSCLIDADRLSTADFEIPENQFIRNNGSYISWDILIDRLEQKYVEFKKKKNRNEVDELREQVAQSCLDFSKRPKGIYQLKVPTGGGKTLASLRFGLHHAKEHTLDRIFYIIPYTSIIDQNADEVRGILEDKDRRGKFINHIVLEHHSNLTPEKETRRQSLLSENWDAPIVFTTQVQFLESLFGAGTRSIRRMHQLARSVIIFDEVQTIPIRCVYMFNLALRFLVHDCGSTVVLCTATQPLLEKVEPPQRALPISADAKIISDEKTLFKKLKRVEVFDRRKAGGWSDEEVADLVEQELTDMGSVLAIVNTKKSARSLYQTLQNRNLAEIFHLSTNMCPAHRLEVLKKIENRLDNKRPVICISTQLIEAGVNIDFGSVIRYMAGLDSIVQAAGRCNRNGKRSSGNVWIVNPQEQNIDRLKDIVIGSAVSERILDEYNNHPEYFGKDRIGLTAIEKFYQYYFYDRKEEMGYRIGVNSPIGRDDELFNLLSLNILSVKEVQRLTNSNPTIPFRQSFQSAARAFYAIDSPTRGVIVPYGKEGSRIVGDLCSASDIAKQYRLIKEAQRYSVNLLPHEFKKMTDSNAVHEVQKDAGIFYLNDQYYSAQFGWGYEPINNSDPYIT